MRAIWAEHVRGGLEPQGQVAAALQLAARRVRRDGSRDGRGHDQGIEPPRHPGGGRFAVDLDGATTACRHHPAPRSSRSSRRRPADRPPPADPRPGWRGGASTPWSWPRPSPTSGPPNAPTAKLGRGDGLTLELEPTQDILAEVGAHRARAGHGPATRPRPVIRPRARRLRGRDGLARRAPRTSSRRKGVDLLVANDVAEAGSGLRHRHQPRHDPRRRTAAATSCRCCPSARSLTGILDRVVAALDARDAAAQTEPMTQESLA